MEAIYKIYDLKKYYPDFIGANPIAVVSNLSEAELLRWCPELRRKAPFVYFSCSQWKGFMKAQHGHGEDRLRKSRERYQDCYGYQEGISELHAADFEEEDILDEVATRISIEHLREVLATLPKAQSRRILLHYSGYSYAEIAAQEKISIPGVHYSIKRGMKNLRKYF